MSDILTNLAAVSSDAKFTLLGTGLGAVLAFAGVWLTNRNNIKQLLTQLNHEQKANEKELLRTRYEELHILSRKYFAHLVGYFLPYGMVMNGELTFNQALDQTIDQGKKDYPDFFRIEMLLDLYFQELLPAFNEVKEIRDRLHGIIDNYKNQYKHGDTNGKSWLTHFNPLLEAFNDKATSFENRVTEYRRNVFVY